MSCWWMHMSANSEIYHISLFVKYLLYILVVTITIVMTYFLNDEKIAQVSILGWIWNDCLIFSSLFMNIKTIDCSINMIRGFSQFQCPFKRSCNLLLRLFHKTLLVVSQINCSQKRESFVFQLLLLKHATKSKSQVLMLILMSVRNHNHVTYRNRHQPQYFNTNRDCSHFPKSQCHLSIVKLVIKWIELWHFSDYLLHIIS